MGRYTVNLSELDGIGVAAISRALETCDVVVIDEIGPMEILSARFIAAVDDTLLSGKPTLISTHAHLDHPLIHRVRQESNHYRVKLGNRDTLIDEIVACFVL